MEHIIVLEDSEFNLSGEGKLSFKRPHSRRQELPLLKPSEAGIEVDYRLLNPIQTAFYRFYKGGSALVSAPTSAGKSLTAFMFMKDSGGRKIYTAPTKALVYEKAVEMGRLFGRKVDMRTGDAIESFKQTSSDVVVSTYENLTLALRNKAPWTEDIECVVIDEVHNIMGSRGWVVEELITSLMSRKVRVLLLSATLPGGEELAKWVDASLFVESFWRPVPLERKILPLKEFEDISGAKDQDGKIAGKLLSALFQIRRPEDQVILFVHKKSIGWRILEIAVKERIGILNRTVPFEIDHDASPEIAFHNADVPKEEREEIERRFRKGDLPVLVATHTLAYGVNLPADTVIIGVRSFYDRKEGEWKVFPGHLDILQMEGRAGRLGIKERGFSFILPYGARPGQLEREIESCLEGEMVPYLKERLTSGDVGGEAEKILSLFILIGFLYEGLDFRRFLERTYSLKKFADDFYIDETFEWLCEKGYIDGSALSDKAKFCLRSGMSPVDYEEFLRRKYIGSDKTILVRPLIFVKRFESLYDFVKGGESFIEDDMYVRDRVAPFGAECFADNTHQLVFYTEGLTFKYRNISQPPGEFSYLGTDALHLLRVLLDIRSFGDISWSNSEILAVSHMIKYGLSEEYASLGGIKGIGHIRANLLKRLLQRENLKPPSLGTPVSNLWELLRDTYGEDLHAQIVDLLLEERMGGDKRRAEAEATQVIRRIKGSLGGFLIDDRILRTFALFYHGPKSLRMSKKELLETCLTV